ncbi:diguanylate cyclase [Stratiformator vulcanicus]|uniref:diguanylate cyclase n=1 Tax=Stratiformator vulcanicus TaxID=2527980 RepID=A0A517R7T8_9PLAN|nr:diguanylate cyclase [Stratiformator vulcanicus]QDT39891.1 putative diguanylate cyclase YdaM [Stratiformator vulcanicus]
MSSEPSFELPSLNEPVATEVPPAPKAGATHPTDSAGTLLSLMTLAKTARLDVNDPSTDEALAGVIAPATLRALLSALNHRDPKTIRHVRRTARLATGVASAFGWDERPLKALEVACLLHDIGKIGVPDSILFKPGALTGDEAELMALHHNIGCDILQACRVDSEVYDIVVQSSQHYNGATDGYRLIGSDVHQGARILAVADAYDSLRTQQVYREAIPHDEIMKKLKAASGTQFDGTIVVALGRWIEQEGPGVFDPELDGGSSGREHPNAPGMLDPNALCQIFSHLYILESLYDGFYLLDADLKVVLWNLGAERLFKKGHQEVLGTNWNARAWEFADLMGNPLGEGEYPLQRVLKEPRAISSGLKYKRFDGKWTEIEIQSIPLIDGNGQLQGVAEIYRDLCRTTFRPNEYRELKMAASRDPLTKIANRGELETQLALHLSEIGKQQDHQPFGVIFCDIDFFKAVNDNYGHQVGDDVLVNTARLLQEECYSGELVARYGGEEFVILCPDTDLEGAVRRAERLRGLLAKTVLNDETELKVTGSFGVSVYEKGDSVESLCRRADKALYQAKETGRNRTCSITSTQLHEDRRKTPDEPIETDPFLAEGHFEAQLASDMIVYKLGGFVDEISAKVKDVTQRQATFAIGTTGMFGGWGKSSQKQAVQLVLEFGEDRRASRPSNSGTEVRYRFTPIGRPPSPEAFHRRVKELLKALRGYFGVQ